MATPAGRGYVDFRSYCAARKRVRRGFLSSAGLGDTAEWLDFVRRTSESSEETKHSTRQQTELSSKCSGARTKSERIYFIIFGSDFVISTVSTKAVKHTNFDSPCCPGYFLPHTLSYLYTSRTSLYYRFIQVQVLVPLELYVHGRKKNKQHQSLPPFTRKRVQPTACFLTHDAKRGRRPKASSRPRRPDRAGVYAGRFSWLDIYTLSTRASTSAMSKRSATFR